jgi:predicted AAA+ superfamily ATPase
MVLIERRGYIDQIAEFIDKPFIKILTGIRRSGKSELLKMLKAEVLKRTDEAHTVFINFEDADFWGIQSHEELNAFFREKLTDDRPYYIFLDEIQQVKGWEKSVNSIRLKGADVYITGSNSKIMSEELATLLGGRTVSFPIYTLSFAEFINFRQICGISDGVDIQSELEEYIRLGGFPALSTFAYSESAARHIVQDINNTALLRDVTMRHRVRMPQLMEKIVAYLYDNVGNILSVASIARYLKSNGRGGDPETIANYVKYLEDAHIVKRAQRYDLKGKKLLETPDKYYLGDHSLQYAVRNLREDKKQGILENIVFMELVRRGYSVYVGGASGGKEIDFIAEKKGDRVYVQVCLEFSNSPSTYRREFDPLTALDDHYPKYVVTMDKYWQANENGVRGIHLKDFLLKTEL